MNAYIIKRLRRLIKHQLVIVICLTQIACSSSWLTNDPTGAVLIEEQYLTQPDALRGTVLGIYPNMYEATDQQWFGQRTVDIYSDLQCGDMTMTRVRYNHFAYSNQGYTYIHRGSIWSYYYRVIRQCNKGINAVHAQGCPTPEQMENASELERERGHYYAILLAMRGWAYAGLQRFFSVQACANQATEPSVPIYTELDTEADATYGNPQATVSQVYRRIEDDLLLASRYYDACPKQENKLLMNRSVALTTLAYAYLNEGKNDSAFIYAEKAIQKATEDGFRLLSNAELLTTGFNDVEHSDWLWGQNVTTDTKTSLGSFWGHVDIFTYSYANMGDVMGIDSLLYEDIAALKWDKRAYWWNYAYRNSPSVFKAFRYAPDGKFYTHRNHSSLSSAALDREYLNDNVYMRLELAYLIAAEAAARDNNLGLAKQYLFAITDQRVISGAESVYTAWKAKLDTPPTEPGKDLQSVMLDAILYNWRVELWGEGYGLQTFRRWNETRTLGANQLRSENAHTCTITPAPNKVWTFQIPSSEFNYNPSMTHLSEIQVGPIETID